MAEDRDFATAVHLVSEALRPDLGFGERHQIRLNIATAIRVARAERDAEVMDAQVAIGAWMQALGSALSERNELRRQVAVKDAALSDIIKARPKWAENVGYFAGGETYAGFAARLQYIAARALRAEKGASSERT